MLSLVDSVSLRPLSGKVHTSSQQGYVENTLITDANHLFQTNEVLCQLTVDSDTASYSELCPAVQRKRLNFEILMLVAAHPMLHIFALSIEFYYITTV